MAATVRASAAAIAMKQGPPAGQASQIAAAAAGDTRPVMPSAGCEFDAAAAWLVAAWARSIEAAAALGGGAAPVRRRD